MLSTPHAVESRLRKGHLERTFMRVDPGSSTLCIKTNTKQRQPLDLKEGERTNGTHGRTFVWKERNLRPILQHPITTSTPPKRDLLTISPLGELFDPRRRESDETDAREILEAEKTSKRWKNVLLHRDESSPVVLYIGDLPSGRELKS